jgi:RNA polymerase primary sigma factor
MSAFARKMDQYPMLSADAQDELIRAYQQCLRVTAAAKGCSPRSREAAKARKAQLEAEQYLTHLVASNFRLVYVICRDVASRRYPSRDRLQEMMPDLIQEGEFALTQAAQRFDSTRNLGFPKYAARAVRDRVRHVLSGDTPTKMPAAWVRTHRIAKHLIPEMTTALGRRPTTPELQEALLVKAYEWGQSHLSPDDEALSAAGRKQAITAKLRKQGMLGAIERVEDILSIAQQSSSLDAKVGDENSTTLGELLTDSSNDSIFDDVELAELRDTLAVALADFTDRERMIILLRYGFVDGEVWTYERIRPRFDVTAERIRQIENQVLEKLRTPAGQYTSLAAFLPKQFDD